MRKLMTLLVILPLLASCSDAFDAVEDNLSKSDSRDNSEYSALMDDQKWEEAINKLEETLHDDPKDAEALAQRALCYYRLKNYDSALRDANEALKIEPQTAAALDARGWTYHDTNEFRKALADFSEEIKLQPKNVSALVARADTYDAMRQGQQGLADYDKAIALDNENATTYRNRGWTYLNIGNCKNAIEDFEESLRLDDSDIAAYLNKATAFMRLETYEQAIEDLDKVLEIDPAYYAAYIYRGTIYLFKKDFDQAITQFKLARDHTTAGSAAWGDLYLYLTYRWMNKDKEAAEAIADGKKRSLSGDWPYPLILYFDRKMTLAEVEQLAISPTERTELRTWVGFDKLLSGSDSGESDLRWVREHGARDDSEYEMVLFADKHKDFLRKAK
jgi:tetratricopeptide (TPR) repeat protein